MIFFLTPGVKRSQSVTPCPRISIQKIFIFKEEKEKGEIAFQGTPMLVFLRIGLNHEINAVTKSAESGCNDISPPLATAEYGVRSTECFISYF